jgi:hypothetical protein
MQSHFKKKLGETLTTAFFFSHVNFMPGIFKKVISQKLHIISNLGAIFSIQISIIEKDYLLPVDW